YTFNSYGYLSQVNDVNANKAIWTPQAVDPDGKVSQELLGNGLTTFHTSDLGAGRLLMTSTTGIPTYPHLDTYAYSLGGDMTKRTMRINGSPATVVDKSESFTYDGAHRLVTAQVAGQAVNSYTYDVVGNMTASNGCTYRYGGDSLGPHALASYTC